MKNLFSVLPNDFFKPLNSKYKDQYADCLLAIYNSYKTEISYGVERNSVVSTLTDYFNTRTDDISFDDENSFEKDSRSKAQKTINYLKDCGWLDFEEEKNYQQNGICSPLLAGGMLGSVSIAEQSGYLLVSRQLRNVE